MTGRRPAPFQGAGPRQTAGAGRVGENGSEPAPTGQLSFRNANAGQLLQRHREATLAVVAATYRGRRRRRYGLGQVVLFSVLADHTNSDGIARVSAADLAIELERTPTHVRADLRALARGGHIEPLELVDGVFVAASRHPRHRAGYLVPGMVAPPPGRPHVVR